MLSVWVCGWDGVGLGLSFFGIWEGSGGGVFIARFVVVFAWKIFFVLFCVLKNVEFKYIMKLIKRKRRVCSNFFFSFFRGGGGVFVLEGWRMY